MRVLCFTRGLCRLPPRKSSLITTPIFYANAAPHLGHLYTSVLSDAALRWATLADPTGTHVMTTGTDEHGTKIARAAAKAGMAPQKYCDTVSVDFKKMCNEFGINHFHYIRTTEGRHKLAVQHFWKTLNDKGLIYKSMYKGWYSVVDECFYTNDDVTDEVIDDHKVKVVKGTNTIVEWVEEENYMFKLSQFRDQIRYWLVSADVIRPKHYLPVVLKMLESDEDLSISRCRKRLEWGIPVPGDDTQTIYVWLDALTNYLTAMGYPGDTFTKWPPTCQVLGKDIIKFHAIYWPAFLLGAGLELPKRLFVHGHWLVDNVKMSKSIGNVVDPFAMSERFTSEGVRYFLLKQGVPHVDSNFTDIKAMQVINSDLVNNFGNLLSRSTVMKLNPHQQYPYYDIISMEQSISASAMPLMAELNGIAERTTHFYDEMMFYKAIESIMLLLKQGNALFQMHEPWKMQQGPQLSTLLYLAYETTRIAAILLQPVIPQYSNHALNRLGVDLNKRGLSAAAFGHESNMVGRPLGNDNGPYMSRIKPK